MTTTANPDPRLVERELPPFIRDLLSAPPTRGEGLNNYLFRLARVLHPWRHPPQIVALIEAATAGCGVKPGEIERAAANSADVAWRPDEGPSDRPPAPPAWPQPDFARIGGIVGEGITASQLIARSPHGWEEESWHADRGDNCAQVVEALFADGDEPDPLLCVGASNDKFATRRLSFWLRGGRLPTFQFIVPSPMTHRRGTTKDGKSSEHTLENTGARRFQVIELDVARRDKAGNLTAWAPLIEARMGGPREEFDAGADICAALLWHLAGYVPLVLVVHSGGKSLHGWFDGRGIPDEALRKFTRYAVSLGADRATWTRSQFVRLPGGRRENGNRQSILYFDPAAMTKESVTHHE